MFDIGFLEIVIVGVIALLVLGPERLPKAAHSAGKWVGKARRMVNQFTREIDRQIELEELKEQLKQQKEALDISKEAEQIKQSVDSALAEAKEFSHASEREFEELPNSIHDPSENHEYEPLPRDDEPADKDQQQTTASSDSAPSNK